MAISGSFKVISPEIPLSCGTSKTSTALEAVRAQYLYMLTADKPMSTIVSERERTRPRECSLCTE
jgi:hypothetical protein